MCFCYRTACVLHFNGGAGVGILASRRLISSFLVFFAKNPKNRGFWGYPRKPLFLTKNRLIALLVHLILPIFRKNLSLIKGGPPGGAPLGGPPGGGGGGGGGWAAAGAGGGGAPGGPPGGAPPRGGPPGGPPWGTPRVTLTCGSREYPHRHPDSIDFRPYSPGKDS